MATGESQGGRKRKRASGWDKPAATAPVVTAPGGTSGAAGQLALAQQNFMQQQLRMGMAGPMGPSMMAMPGQMRGGAMAPMAMQQMAAHAQAQVSLTAATGGGDVGADLRFRRSKGQARRRALPYRADHQPTHAIATIRHLQG